MLEWISATNRYDRFPRLSHLPQAALFLVTPAGDELLKRFHLSHPIIPEKSSFRVSSMKIEVCVRKQTEIRWTQLEDVSTTDSG
ncbi:suppressor of G2 allele of SKP1 [Clonorchis sinensis]|uniref:Suppressor of G2 allele of SKP1 n=1 Tax=Clonorchis sinensis TaxID=79923 RepID=G7YXC5_CLOSI|nr:suppressor of G2 allele of SKP1 [Clonorchis sinensis]